MFWYEKHTYRPMHCNYMKEHMCSAFSPGLLEEHWRSRWEKVTVQRSGEEIKLICSSSCFAILRFMRAETWSLSLNALFPEPIVNKCCSFSRNICWLIDWKKIKPNAIPTALREKKKKKKKTGNMLNCWDFSPL